MSHGIKKHISMAAVIIGSLAAGINMVTGQVGMMLIMGGLVGLNVITAFYHARKEVEIEDQD